MNLFKQSWLCFKHLKDCGDIKGNPCYWCYLEHIAKKLAKLPLCRNCLPSIRKVYLGLFTIVSSTPLQHFYDGTQTQLLTPCFLDANTFLACCKFFNHHFQFLAINPHLWVKQFLMRKKTGGDMTGNYKYPLIIKWCSMNNTSAIYNCERFACFKSKVSVWLLVRISYFHSKLWTVLKGLRWVAGWCVLSVRWNVWSADSHQAVSRSSS